MTESFVKHNMRWLCLFLLLWGALLVVIQTLSRHSDMARLGHDIALWQPLSWELSSVVAVMSLVSPLVMFTHRYPLDTWRPLHWLFHAIVFFPFTLLHIAIMVGLRELWYAAAGADYNAGDWFAMGLYELRKDIVTYLTVLAFIYLWDFILRRAKGEASLIQQKNEGDPQPKDSDNERILIKKLGREYLVGIADIHWIEAAGNYVNLYSIDSVYPMRATMATTEKRFAEQGFRRIHRSAIVSTYLR
ncbi:MAG: LytTR family DNA-binding domain-containing protein [Motiliproteus sp.]